MSQIIRGRPRVEPPPAIGREPPGREPLHASMKPPASSAPWRHVCHNGPVRSALLVSTYDLGHQPFGLASPAAWLAHEDVEVRCLDLARERLDENAVRAADFIAFHLPMHTATRMAGPVIRKVRRINPAARICAYGLYAPLNADWLREVGADDVIGVEFEQELAAMVRSLRAGTWSGAARTNTPHMSEPTGAGRTLLPKLQFITPDRRTLPALNRYAAVRLADGSARVAGYTEASRGCRHLCRHCPIVPVYRGQFRIVQDDIVMADIANQVASGAAHITFGDPDFFNGPTHALRVVRRLHDMFPAVTYDVTIKVEHLLRHHDLLPVLRGTGCLFVTSAVESIDDTVLALLDKGHTRHQFERAVALCREVDLVLSPTFVPFHPWTSLDGYCELLETIVRLDLVQQVAPIQLAIRLLVPAGSRLLELDQVRSVVTDFDRQTLAHGWKHADPAVDDLHAGVTALVGGRLTSDRTATFAAIWSLAHERSGRPTPPPPLGSRLSVPYLDEPWYCCAEPNPEQLMLM
jgi:radical SAM superfamily enzyme YgiQ (UPF0313 family)